MMLWDGKSVRVVCVGIFLTKIEYTEIWRKLWPHKREFHVRTSELETQNGIDDMYQEQGNQNFSLVGRG